MSCYSPDIAGAEPESIRRPIAKSPKLPFMPICIPNLNEESSVHRFISTQLVWVAISRSTASRT
jgi:hypothetical protein